MGCLLVCLGGDEALRIGPPWEFDGFQEVSQDLLEPFKFVVSSFTVYGWQFGRPVLEEGGDLLDHGQLVL